MVALACHIVFIRLITVTNLTWQQRCVLPLLYHWPIISKERDKVPGDECAVRGYIGGCDVQHFVIAYNYSFVLGRAVLFYSSCSSCLCLRPPSSPSCMPVVLLRKRWRDVSSSLFTFLLCLNCTPYYVRHKLIDGGDPVAMVTGEASSAACVDFRFLVPCWLGDGC